MLKNRMITTATRDATLRDIILDCIKTRTAINERDLLKHHMEGVQMILGFWHEMKRLLAACGILTGWEPKVPTVGGEIGRFPFNEQRGHLQRMRSDLAESIADCFIQELSDGLKSLRIGRIQQEGKQTYVFNFFTRGGSVKSNLLTKFTDVTDNEHTLVNARRHRAPADHLTIPGEAKLILAALPRKLVKYAYILTGDRILKKSEVVGEESERTGLGKFVDGVVVNGKAIAAGTAAVAGMIGAGVAASMASAGPFVSAAVVADPALVLGEYVFIGWD